MLYGLTLLMKKRASVKSKRRVSFRKSISRSTGSWFDRLRETVNRRREFVFLLFILAMGMLVFDIIGYDYTGLVIENNAVSGAQSVEGVGTALRIIPDLLYQFMDPISYLFTGANYVNTWRLVFAFILFLIISPILSKMEHFKDNNGRNGKIIALILAVAFGALFPGPVIANLLGDGGPVIQIILLIVYGALVFYLARWLYTKAHGSDRVGRVVILVMAIIFILLTIFLGSIFTDTFTNPQLKNIFNLIFGIGVLSQLVIGGWSVFLAGTPTQKDMERIQSRDSEAEAARTFRRGREERENRVEEERRGRNRNLAMGRLEAAYRAQVGLFRNSINALRARPRSDVAIKAAFGNLMRSFTDEQADLNGMGARDHISENVPPGRASMVNAYDDLVRFNGTFTATLRRQMDNRRIAVLATDDNEAMSTARILANAIRQKNALLSRLR